MIVRGPQLGTVCKLAADEFSIGRESSNHLELRDLAISRRHLIIRRNGGQFFLSDLDSANGTLLNGFPVQAGELRDGDEIALGGTALKFVLEGPEELPVPTWDDDIAGKTVKIPAGITAISSATESAQILDALLKLCQSLSTKKDLEGLERAFLETAIQLTRADRGMLLRRNLATPDSFNCSGSIAGTGWRTEPFAVSRTALRELVQETAAVLVPSLPEHPLGQAESLRENVRSLLLMPILAGPEIRSILYLDSSSENPCFNAERAEILRAAAAVLVLAIDNLLRCRSLEEENLELRAESQLRHNMVGDSACMREIYRRIAKIATSDATVLILGESGTGKELAARAVHQNSGRSAARFVAVNCALLSETLLESELFGHERGAFTGAVTQKMGKLEIADGGTLFLDEVGELSLPIQSKLLRVVQEREFERLGGTQSRHVDLRIVAATHRNLEEAVSLRAFREDLYYRLKVISLVMPALRDRREDIPALARYLVERCSYRAKHRIDSIEPDAMRLLASYSWPGNIRELENAIEHAIVMGEGPVLRAADLPESVFESDPGPESDSGHYYCELNEAKRRIIRQALEAANWNITQAALELGLNRTYLHRLVRNLRIVR